MENQKYSGRTIGASIILGKNSRIFLFPVQAEKKKEKSPDFELFVMTEEKDGKAFWTKIAALWPTQEKAPAPEEGEDWQR